jgi:hypothetical protein
MNAARLRALVARAKADLDLLEAELAAAEQGKADWYDSASYPHGPRAFRRHVSQGLPVIRVGRGYRARREDVEAFWASHRIRIVERRKSKDAFEAAGLRRVQ